MNETPIKVSFSQDQFLDVVMKRLRVRSDAALSRLLRIDPGVISHVRRGKRSVTASLLIGLHEYSGISIEELREIMGDRRSKFRVGTKSMAAEEMRSGRNIHTVIAD